MRKSFIYRLSAVALVATALATTTSCNDWTDSSSLQLHNPSFEEQNPGLYADYLKDLRRYKQEEHKLMFVSFDNPAGTPAKQAEHLTDLPDSVDFVCLNNPDNLSPAVQKEMKEVRDKKGTRTLYRIDYAAMEDAWTAMQKADPNLTEADALDYIAKNVDEQLALCDRYNFDGLIADYTGRSTVSMLPAALAQYDGRQKAFFGAVTEWRASHADKTLAFYGNVQYLVPANMGMMDQYDYIMLKTVNSTSEGDLSLKAYMDIQAGIDAGSDMPDGLNPVPTDRFVACVELPQADDKNQVRGYWNMVGADGGKTLAVLGAAAWMNQESTDFTREGLFVINAQSDYYNNTYAYVRKAIGTMNPN
ncbi:MAG: glycoside hydrolase family 18 [Mediterranea sp.]|nr:glycoside hydrolase family 18 [Mediterranea sp.]